MKTSKKSAVALGVFILLLLSYGAWLSVDRRQPLPNQVEKFRLTSDEIEKLQYNAMQNKDGASAWRLAEFYSFSSWDEGEFKRWLNISAELGVKAAISTLQADPQLKNNAGE